LNYLKKWAVNYNFGLVFFLVAASFHVLTPYPPPPTHTVYV
jgi:hypothetical protein